MRQPHLRFLAAIALAAMLSGTTVLPVLARWSHSAVAPPGATLPTTTTSVAPAPPNFVLTATVSGRTLVVPVGSILTATTVTSPGVVTTTLNIPPQGSIIQVPSLGLSVSASSFQIGAPNPPTIAGGVITTTVNGAYLGGVAPIPGTLTVSTVIITSPQAATSSTALPRGLELLSEADNSDDVEAAVKTLSDEAQRYLSACEITSRGCFADALDAYAAALKKIAPRLPPQLRSLPSVVATAARKVRAAKTTAEALRALKTAITQVHKSIALLKADEVTFGAGTREGMLVAQTLQVASDRLEKAVGL